uniref:Uncharacterized protein n=1 Tax=Tanacetum cinerariifolium TaxID=118510 RepID=A0A6L2M6W9_TANCI|nr:hypothetical protein [Tanacetum cinerariifolium]
MTLFNGSCDNCIYRNGKPIICTACGSMVKGGLCLPCDLREKNSYNCDPNAYFFDNSNYFPQSQNENYLCNLCGNNSHDGYDCQQQFLFVHEKELSYNQNYDVSTDGPKYRFSGSDQMQTPQYPEIHLSSQETSNKVFQANHYVQNEESSNEIAVSNSNQEKEEPPQYFDICQLIREECSTEVSEEQNALNSKLLLINSNSQHLDKKEQEVKNVVEQPAERGNRNIQSLQNFRAVHKSYISSNTSQISSIHAIAPVLLTKEPEHLLSMGYEHLSITPEMESDQVTEFKAENLVPIPSKCEVTLEDKRECDMPISKNSPVCDNNSDIFFDSKIDDDISVYDDDFEDVEYVEASLPDPEIVSVEEENVVQQEEEEVDFEDISQIQDIVLREKLLSITRLISNIESLNDNSTPDDVLNSFVTDNSLLDNFSSEFETFCDHTEETRSGNTTHANDSLLEYDSFCFEIEPDQEMLINLVKRNIPDNSSNDSLLEEADVFLAFDNSIPPDIENVADDPEGDIRFLEELLIDGSILSHAYDWSFQADEEPTNYTLMAFTSLSSLSSDNAIAPCSKACTKAYDTLQSHYDKLTNDLRKSQFDILSYKTGLESVEARLVVYQHNENVFEEDIKVLKLNVMLRNNALVELRKKFEKAETERDELKLKLEKFQTSLKNLKDNSEGEPMPTQKAPSFIEHVKTPMPSFKPVEHPIPVENLRKAILKSRGNRHSWNRKACFVCKSLTYLIKDCDYYQKKLVNKPVWNHALRTNRQNYARITHPHSKKHVVPITGLTRSRLVPLTAARPVTIVVPHTNVTRPRPSKTVVHKPHSPIRRTINHKSSHTTSNFHHKVTTVKANRLMLFRVSNETRYENLNVLS